MDVRVGLKKPGRIAQGQGRRSGRLKSCVATRVAATPFSAFAPTSRMLPRPNFPLPGFVSPAIRRVGALALSLVLGWVCARPTPAAEPPSPLPPGSDLPAQVLLELNRVRTEPGRYAEFLASRRSAYREDKKLVLPGQPALKTREGVAALDEAITALNALGEPRPALTADERLARVARALADDQAASGTTGHTDGAGGTLNARLTHQGELSGTAGENLAYGAMSASEIVFTLVVDDGVPGRGHRQNILNGDLHLVGVALAAHPKWTQVCVIDFAQGWR